MGFRFRVGLEDSVGGMRMEENERPYVCLPFLSKSCDQRTKERRCMRQTIDNGNFNKMPATFRPTVAQQQRHTTDCLMPLSFPPVPQETGSAIIFRSFFGAQIQLW